MYINRGRIIELFQYKSTGRSNLTTRQVHVFHPLSCSSLHTAWPVILRTVHHGTDSEKHSQSSFSICNRAPVDLYKNQIFLLFFYFSVQKCSYQTVFSDSKGNFLRPFYGNWLDSFLKLIPRVGQWRMKVLYPHMLMVLGVSLTPNQKYFVVAKKQRKYHFIGVSDKDSSLMDLMKKPRHTLGLNLVELRNISSFRTPRVVSSFYKQ